MSNNDDQMIKQLKQQLDQEASQLKPETVNALDKLRREAVQEAEKTRSKGFQWNYWSYAPALAASVLVVMLLISTNTNDNAVVDVPIQISEIQSSEIQPSGFEIAVMNEDMELLEEDVEFYLWLAEESVSG